MKKKIAWITDSVSCIPQDTAAELGIHVVPLSLIFNESVYKDGIDLTETEFISLLKEHQTVPTTSQPAIGEFVDLYSKLKEEYELGIAVHVTSKVSGTFSTSMVASKMANFPMFHIDSKIGASAQEYMVLEGMKKEAEGKVPEQIVAHLLNLTETTRGIALAGNLEQLHKGGRVSGLGYLIGNILQIKPILEFNNGSLVPFEKVRTLKKAERRMIEIFLDSYKPGISHGVSIAHCNAVEKASEFKSKILDVYPDLDIKMTTLSPAIAAHVGEGTVALFWFQR